MFRKKKERVKFWVGHSPWPFNSVSIHAHRAYNKVYTVRTRASRSDSIWMGFSISLLMHSRCFSSFLHRCLFIFRFSSWVCTCSPTDGIKKIFRQLISGKKFVSQVINNWNDRTSISNRVKERINRICLFFSKTSSNKLVFVYYTILMQLQCILEYTTVFLI